MASERHSSTPTNVAMAGVRRALVSVSDKRGLVELGAALIRNGVEILSTGGTARHLVDHGIAVTAVAEVTGFPEILDGRVKTLHPKIHGGILADRSKPDHLEQLSEHAIGPIDLVIANLYPFSKTIAQPEVERAEAVEMIDIGGPSMVRAAAKNHGSVTVIVDPDDYPEVAAAIESGGVSTLLRRRLAAKAFRHTERYDHAIADWLETVDREGDVDRYPETLKIDLERIIVPRYGENPHQAAAAYRTASGPGIFSGFEQHQGKELSWNNLLDADAARKMAALFDQPAVVIVKHNNPCGIGLGGSLVEAYSRALATDPVSAFGSIIAVNRPVEGKLAEAMAKLFVEVIVAPGYDDAARERYGQKKNLRLLTCPPYSGADELELRAIDGGYLAQDADGLAESYDAWTCPTERRASDAEMKSLHLAWAVSRYTKSNAIVLANEIQTVGVGAGQMSRIDSCRIAIRKATDAKLPTAGCAAASDAFFPFRDGLDVLADAGVTAVVQPGGSKRDDEVIAAADERGLAMMLTGRRHFRH